MAVQYIASNDPTLCGSALKREGRRQTDRRSAHAGSRLKLIDASGKSHLICQPFSRNGENPPYGMLGGIVETSASFEARSAPRSYPAAAGYSLCLIARIPKWLTFRTEEHLDLQLQRVLHIRCQSFQL